MKRGAFILFEGVDRCGKSTQCSLLSKNLQAKGLEVLQVRFPDRTTSIGKMIDSYLKSSVELDDKAVHLLFSANRWEMSSQINEALNAGKIVVADRYAFSGVAFSASKKGMCIDWCKNSDRGLPAPDIVLYMDLPIEKAELRGKFGEERYEVKDMQIRVRENFQKLMEPSTWEIIDADDTIENLSENIEKIAMKTIRNVNASPIKHLFVSESDTVPCSED